MLFLILPQSVFGVRFGDVANVPSDYWAVFTPYGNALDANDSVGIVTHGRNIINYWLAGATAEQRAAQLSGDVLGNGFIINDLYIVSFVVAEHYELLGNREGALWAYRNALVFSYLYQELVRNISIGVNPDDIDFSRMLIRNRISSLDVSISVFAEMRDGSGAIAYFGALHEPRSGVFFGEQPGTSTVASGLRTPSAVTIYVEFETEDLRDRVTYDLYKNQSMHGISRYDYSIIQIAWNFLYEGRTPPTVRYQTQKITEAAQFLNSTGLPILLRIAAEPNVWTTPANSVEYIDAFRYIANIMRREAPNVALVYSVNSVSAVGRDWQLYYPGDAYVDWVGISLYSTRYFMGNPHTTYDEAAIYRTGRYANPIGYIQELVEQFGDRKPLLISEGAVSLFNLSNREDLTEWALPVMRQVYSYVPMLFPQIKAIFWFNVYLADGNMYHPRYDFAVSSRALDLYIELTSSEYFLVRGRQQSPITFQELGTAVMPANNVTLLTFAPFFTLSNLVVQYRLNGEWIGEATDIPYRRTFDLSSYSDGEYILRVDVLHYGNLLASAEYNLVKHGNTVVISDSAIYFVPEPESVSDEIRVLLNGQMLSFDVPPQIIDDRTMVPLRGIFEAMNASVDWDQATQTVTAILGDITVSLRIGSNELIRNGAVITLDVPAQIVNDRTLVPARAVAESFGANVDWDEATRTVIITQ